MKQTGIVRRIDNLGRIVIPKELRKTLHIHDGELLELIMNKDEIILRKYSTVKELSHLFIKFIEVFEPFIKSNILITDLDQILVTSSKIKNMYAGKLISKFVVGIINNRNPYLSSDMEEIEIIEDQVDNVSCYIVPFIVAGDPVGSLVIFSRDSKLDSMDITLANIVGSFINKYIEE